MIPTIDSAAVAAVLDVVLRATLILLAAHAATSLMRRSSASARHLVWLAALLAVLLLPLARGIVPEWRVLPVPQAARGAFAAAEAPASAAPALVAPHLSTAAAPVPEPAGVSWPGLLALLWAAGAALIALRLAFGLVRVRWMASRAVELTDDDWIRLTDGLARRLRLGRIVRLLRGPGATVPMTWGIFSPVILLPGEAEAWDEERRRVVLAHELAHVGRWDALTQWIAHVAVAVYWFNPLVWMAARKLREEREHACDDAVLTAGARPAEYADHLLTIVRSMGSRDGGVAALAMARRSQFEGRLLAILDSAVRRNGVTRAAALATLAASAVCVLPLAALQAVDLPAPPRPEQAAGIPALEVQVAGEALPLPSADSAPAAEGELERSPPSPATPAAVPPPALEGANQGQLEKAGAEGDPRLYAEMIRAAAEIEDDASRRSVLTALLYRPDLSRDNVIAIISATRTMRSPAERQPVLLGAVWHRAFRTSDPAVVEALSAFSSFAEHRIVLQNLLLQRLTQAELIGALRAAAHIRSGRDLRVVLQTAAERHRLEAAAREVYLAAARSIDSDSERGLALQALLRQPRPKPSDADTGAVRERTGT